MPFPACTQTALAALLSVAATAQVHAVEPLQHNAPVPAQWQGPYPWNYQGTLERRPRPALVAGACASAPTPRVLLAGDSWAQYMWDDDAHNELFDEFGQADHLAVSRSLGSNPGPGYGGPEYAISGSEAREWVDTANYPWIANVVAELEALPTIDTVVFSLGGNDILAGKSGGGWYKDMDLDVPGSEEALFTRILADSDSILAAFTAVRPQIDVLVSSYEYPNFNVSAFWCWIYACPKRRDLSRDPDNALVTDAEINAMNLAVESRRIAWTNADPRLHFDHGDGEMHHYHGDGVSAPGALPRPGQQAPGYLPFPGGNPLRPSLRENFRQTSGISADPIHLNADGYRYKVAVQTESYFFPRFRGTVSQTLTSLGGAYDGWADGVVAGTDGIALGDDGTRLIRGIASFDTSVIPANAVIGSASLYLLQETRSGANPFLTGNLGAPRLDVAASFGTAEVEAGDAVAPADAEDAGCFVGSANAKYYAIRIDLTPAALAAIRRDGITQFRIGFSSIDAGIDRVQFSDGDAPASTAQEFQDTHYTVEELRPDGTIQSRQATGTALVHRGIAEVLGNARPFLDLRYVDLIFSDGFESPAMPGANH